MAPVKVTPISTFSVPQAGSITFYVDEVDIDPNLAFDDDLVFQLTTKMSAAGGYACLLIGQPFHVDYYFESLQDGARYHTTDPVSVWAPNSAGEMTVQSPWIQSSPFVDAGQPPHINIGLAEPPSQGLTYRCIVKATFDFSGVQDCTDPVTGYLEFVFDVSP